jgi:hypothetical protein
MSGTFTNAGVILAQGNGPFNLDTSGGGGLVMNQAGCEFDVHSAVTIGETGPSNAMIENPLKPQQNRWRKGQDSNLRDDSPGCECSQMPANIGVCCSSIAALLKVVYTKKPNERHIIVNAYSSDNPDGTR